MDLVGSAVGIDNAAAQGVGSGDGGEALGHSGVEAGVHGLIAVESLVPRHHAVCGDDEAGSKHKRTVGLSWQQAREPLKQRKVGSLAVALIGQGAVGETVTDDGHAGVKCGQDGADQVLGTGGKVQVSLGRGGPALNAVE